MIRTIRLRLAHRRDASRASRALRPGQVPGRYAIQARPVFSESDRVPAPIASGIPIEVEWVEDQHWFDRRSSQLVFAGQSDLGTWLLDFASSLRVTIDAAANGVHDQLALVQEADGVRSAGVAQVAVFVTRTFSIDEDEGPSLRLIMLDRSEVETPIPPIDRTL